MTRYQLIDTTTGEVVREQATLYGQSRYTRRRKSSLTPLDQERLIWCVIGLVFGIVLF